MIKNLTGKRVRLMLRHVSKWGPSNFVGTVNRITGSEIYLSNVEFKMSGFGEEKADNIIIIRDEVAVIIELEDEQEKVSSE